ncbi:ABC-2 family transporter protein [Candidatus Woesearchaeota archaeon]|nr:ABC-2 family transporter protein [Candidatus Woesearchaeota archaeon]
MGVKKQLAVLGKIYKLEFKSALEYRFNFIMQTLGMFINDIFWLIFWFIFFNKFNTLNGWTLETILYLNSVIVLSWGLTITFFGNWRKISRLIQTNGIDYYLTMPKEILSHTLARFTYSGLGDILFGITLAVVVLQWRQVPLYILLVICSALIYLSWGIIIHSMSFFVGKFENAAKVMTEALLTFSFYPFSVYTGATKFFLLFILPAGLVGSVPVELLKSFSWKWLAIVVGMTLIFLTIAIIMFYSGLKRYESGNTMEMRG